MTYIKMSSKAKDSFSPFKSWFQSDAANWRCPGCGKPKPDHGEAVDVVVSKISRKTTVDFLMGFAGFCIVSVDVIAALASVIDNYSYIGRVSDASGTPSPTHVTLRLEQKPLYIRGDEKSARRICTNCGRLIYLATGKPYLCGRYTSKVLQADFGQLLVRSDVFEEKLAQLPMHGVALTRLEVLVSSRDKLPVDTKELVAEVRRQSAGDRNGDGGQKRGRI